VGLILEQVVVDLVWMNLIQVVVGVVDLVEWVDCASLCRMCTKEVLKLLRHLLRLRRLARQCVPALLFACCSRTQHIILVCYICLPRSFKLHPITRNRNNSLINTLHTSTVRK